MSEFNPLPALWDWIAPDWGRLGTFVLLLVAGSLAAIFWLGTQFRPRSSKQGMAPPMLDATLRSPGTRNGYVGTRRRSRRRWKRAKHRDKRHPTVRYAQGQADGRPVTAVALAPIQRATDAATVVLSREDDTAVIPARGERTVVTP